MTECFCDASFNPKTKIAIIGYQIGDNPIDTTLLHDTNNTRAEITGLIMLLTKIVNNTIDNDNQNNKEYIIYTDCQSILNRIESKDKLIKKNFMNRKNEKLNNADLYKELFDLLEGRDNISLKHNPGHMPKKNMTSTNKKFSILDKLVRQQLREFDRQTNKNV